MTEVALIKGDGIGVDVSEAAMAVVEAALSRVGLPMLAIRPIQAGAGYFAETGADIEPGGVQLGSVADSYVASGGLAFFRATTAGGSPASCATCTP